MTFHKGAKILPPKPIDRTLSLTEASFVMCAVAERERFSGEEEFLAYMTRAWRNYQESALTMNTRDKHPAPQAAGSGEANEG